METKSAQTSANDLLKEHTNLVVDLLYITVGEHTKVDSFHFRLKPHSL